MSTGWPSLASLSAKITQTTLSANSGTYLAGYVTVAGPHQDPRSEPTGSATGTVAARGPACSLRSQHCLGWPAADSASSPRSIASAASWGPLLLQPKAFAEPSFARSIASSLGEIGLWRFELMPLRPDP